MNKLLAALAIVVTFLSLPRLARAEEVAPEPTPVQATGHVHAMFGGGYAYGQLFGLGARTTAIEGGLVVDASRRLAITAGADVELGKTMIADLPMGDVALFGTIDGVLGRLRIGGGPQLSFFWMSRSGSSESGIVDALGLGLRGRVTLDVLRLDDPPADTGRALYLAISPSCEWLRGPSSVLDFTAGSVAWRANATVGLRL